MKTKILGLSLLLFNGNIYTSDRTPHELIFVFVRTSISNPSYTPENMHHESHVAKIRRLFSCEKDAFSCLEKFNRINVLPANKTSPAPTFQTILAIAHFLRLSETEILLINPSRKRSYLVYVEQIRKTIE